MHNLTTIVISVDKDFRWELYYDSCGGFIGLRDVKHEYNVWSTQVKYDLEELIKDAEFVHKLINNNIQNFKNHICDIDIALIDYKEFDTSRDFEEFEKTIKKLHTWIDSSLVFKNAVDGLKLDMDEQ